jgi:Bacterial membrane protein YfhO
LLTYPGSTVPTPIATPATATAPPPRSIHWNHGIGVFAGFSAFFTLFFAPILFHDLLFGEGDGLVYYLPAFLSSPQLWSDRVFGGYPIAADPQMMTWYPVAMLLRWIPHSWNVFIILAYILAASFAYCYSLTITRSRFAALCAGLVYSLSGFMIGHLSHVTMVHAAAWIPLVLAALENLRHRFNRQWWAIGIVAVACCWLGGHPQITVYGLGLGVFYAIVLGWTAPIGRWRYYGISLSVLTLGLLLCAIQILPTWQLSKLSVRAAMTFQSFNDYSLPAWQSIQLLFPYLFGGAELAPYVPGYWGKWFLVELSGYVGLMPLMLAIVSLVGDRRRRLVYFWLVVGTLAFLFAMANDTPLGALLFKVPVYNKFRAQGRHMVEVAMAASALTGLGITTIQQRWITRRRIATIVGLSLVSMVGLSLLLIFPPIVAFYQQQASNVGLSALDFRPWRNPSVGIPLLTVGLSGMALLLWGKHRTAPWAMAILSVTLLWDLASFSWFWSWQPAGAANTASIAPPPAAQFFQQRLAANHQRLITTQGSVRSGNDRLAPNMTRVWQLPNASGYTPLMLSRVGEMMNMNYGGVVNQLPTSATNRSLDLMAIRYAVVPPPVTQGPIAGIHWSPENLPIAVGTGACAANTNPTVRLDLPPTLPPVAAIGIVSSLSCSPPVPNNVEIAQIQAIGADRRIHKLSLQAGRDTSEWAYDCADVKPTMRHRRAPLFQQVGIEKPGAGRCNYNSYVSILPLDQAQPIRQLVIQSRPVAGVPSVRLDIQKISLLHAGPPQSSQISAFGLTPNLDGTPRWQAIADLSGTTVYENKLAMPRTWLVSEWIQATPPQILAAIQTGKLPDGREFDPHRMALVEGWGSQKWPDLQPSDIAKVVTIADTQVKIQTQTVSPAFLILSDVNYPGWQVTIDGQSAPLLPVNYVQRGVQVPAGTHLVQFAFRPRIFRVGVAGTIIAGLATILSLTTKPPAI